MKAQYAILRMKKYKGQTIAMIEAHNERLKETYASNPDINLERSKYNFHLLKPQGRYLGEADQMIKDSGCRVRKDSVKMIEVLITASPEFFAGKKPREVKAFFDRALEFMKTKQNENTYISAVVHVDEKTPHMHLCFVPLTPDNRLSAKQIVGNKKNLTKWQDDFWKHMVQFYPDLERGESASKTGRTNIPPQRFKEAAHLIHLNNRLMELLNDTNPLTAKKRQAEIRVILQEYIPGAEKMRTHLKKYDAAFKELKAEKADLEKQLDNSKESSLRHMELLQKEQELEEYRKLVNSLPENIWDYVNEIENQTDAKIMEEIAYD